MFKNALVSVSNKEGLVEFLKPLVAQGLRVVSTGGTSKHLRENGIPVVEVSDQTGFPEVMDGRVRTLHPKIHMALLARSLNQDDMNLLKEQRIDPFDLVIVNLYPFEKALEAENDLQEQVEYIDIGGPALLRASAKSFERITVVCDPKDYEWIAKSGRTTLEERRRLAGKVFYHVASYDSMIAHFLTPEEKFEDYSWGGQFIQRLRYGENPHQEAIWLRERGAGDGLHKAEILQGKALSFNNILDLEAAVSTLREFEEITSVGVKHNNPCGVASDSNLLRSVKKMIASDPLSIFGGIVACSARVDEDTARELGQIFLECVIAPDYTAKAIEVLQSKKNLRVLRWSGLMNRTSQWDLRSISGGFLIQSPDRITEWQPHWKIIGETPDDKIKNDLMFAWKVCAHLKSNAIAIASQSQTLGLGMGQVNRVDSVRQAVERMRSHHPNAAQAVLASDAFFPFPDSIQVAAQNGIRWIIQPGGSMRDSEVEACAKELRVNMILTGERHFKH